MMPYFYYAFIALVGSFLQGVSGMGFGMFSMAFWTLLLPFVPVLTSVRFLTVLFIIGVIKHWKKVRWAILMPPCVASILGNLLAAKVLLALPESILKILLGIMILVFALLGLWNNNKIKIRPRLHNGIMVGIITGFCSGISGVGGPPLAIYYLNTAELADDKEAYYATMIMTFQLIGFTQIITSFASGLVTPEALKLVAIGFLPVVLGIVAGKAMFKRLPVEKMKKMIYLLTLVMGTMLIVTSK
jgi:uncharacterized membrane protein YfcA